MKLNSLHWILSQVTLIFLKKWFLALFFSLLNQICHVNFLIKTQLQYGNFPRKFLRQKLISFHKEGNVNKWRFFYGHDRKMLLIIWILIFCSKNDHVKFKAVSILQLVSLKLILIFLVVIFVSQYQKQGNNFFKSWTSIWCLFCLMNLNKTECLYLEGRWIRKGA